MEGRGEVTAISHTEKALVFFFYGPAGGSGKQAHFALITGRSILIEL